MAGNGGRRGGARNSLQYQTSRWRMCLGSLSCFGSRKRRNRIVPSSRITDGSPPSGSHGNHPRTSTPSSSSAQTRTIDLTPSLLAPPSSPSSSFSLSPISATSLEEHPSFIAGPYAGDTRLFSPPVFSTEPSTAPLTTPSSPDVPIAQFLSFLSHGYFFEQQAGERSRSGGSVSLSRSSSIGGEKESWMEASYRASFGFSADELPAMDGDAAEIGEHNDDGSSFTMSPFFYAEPSLTDFLQPGGLRGRVRKDNYYLSLSDAEVEYDRTRSWSDDRCIFLHGYC